MRLVSRTGFCVAILFAFSTSARAEGPTVESLIKIIEDPDRSVDTRMTAINRLQSHKEKAEPALPVLRSLLLGKDKRFADLVYLTLGHIGKPAVPAIAEALTLPPPYPANAAATLSRVPSRPARRLRTDRTLRRCEA